MVCRLAHFNKLTNTAFADKKEKGSAKAGKVTFLTKKASFLRQKVIVYLFFVTNILTNKKVNIIILNYNCVHNCFLTIYSFIMTI